MTKVVKIGINGMGRIGRTVLRAILQEKNPFLKVVAINNPGKPERYIHLFKYDSTHGRFPLHTEFNGEDLFVDGETISFFNHSDPSDIPWADREVDIVIDSTGVFKDKVEDIFLLKYMAVMHSRDGRSYLNLILADSTGDIEARKWTEAEKVFSTLAKGDSVKVKGKVNLYQNRYQLIIQDIEKFEGNDDSVKEALVPRSENNPDMMFDELVSIVREKLDDVYIKDLLEMILFDPEVTKRLKVWQAGKTIHHAYQSGLLEHILSCAQLAITLSPHYKVNKNYVVLGAILHDICKIYELSQGPLVEYSDEGKLVGHLVKSVEIVDHYASKIRLPSVS